SVLPSALVTDTRLNTRSAPSQRPTYSPPPAYPPATTRTSFGSCTYLTGIFRDVAIATSQKPFGLGVSLNFAWFQLYGARGGSDALKRGEGISAQNIPPVSPGATIAHATTIRRHISKIAMRVTRPALAGRAGVAGDQLKNGAAEERSVSM